MQDQKRRGNKLSCSHVLLSLKLLMSSRKTLASSCADQACSLFISFFVGRSLPWEKKEIRKFEFWCFDLSNLRLHGPRKCLSVLAGSPFQELAMLLSLLCSEVKRCNRRGDSVHFLRQCLYSKASRVLRTLKEPF